MQTSAIYQSDPVLTMPQTGRELADIMRKDLTTLQKQYRRVYADTLPSGQIADFHILNVCKCYPDAPLSLQLSADNKQTGRHLHIVKADRQTDKPTGANLVDLLADDEADNTLNLAQEIETMKAHYEVIIENHRSELKKMADERDEARNRQTDNTTKAQIEADMLRQVVSRLQTEADMLNRTISDTEADKQTLQTEADTLRQTVQTLQTDKETTVRTCQTEADTLRQTVEILQTELNRVKASWSFKFKTLLNAELEAINVLSIAFAIYGFYILFGIVGLFMSVVMALFLKNTIKNMKSAKKRVVEFGMNVAIFCEIIFGLFHFTTFYNILLTIEDQLIIPHAGFVAFMLAAIFSGLSISSLRQQNNLS